VPLGVVIRNSNVIRPLPADYYFLSVLKDKTCLIGDNARYNLVFSDMNDALGGRYLLVQDKADKSASLNTNVEPRTAVGTLSPKKLVFIFVDGRRAGYSTGITMAGLSKMFRAIGATDAINLDGGGSTTFIIKDKDGQYITRNKPSDNSERAVANAWMIMQDK
jgi:exopolysaccharide biosynthesis protein